MEKNRAIHFDRSNRFQQNNPARVSRRNRGGKKKKLKTESFVISRSQFFFLSLRSEENINKNVIIFR